MYSQQLPGHYLSQGTQGPTVTLGDHYSPHRRTNDINVSRKQNINVAMTHDQLPHNLKLQYQKQLNIYHSEIQALKEQIEFDEKEKQNYQDMILNMKKQRTALNSQNMKLSQQNEKCRILIQKLKIDNSSMQMEINRFRNQRKGYYNSINNIDALKNDLTQQIHQKNKNVEHLTHQLRKIEKHHSECKYQLQEYQNLVKEAEIEKQQLREQLKTTLEKYLAHGNILSKLETQLKQVNQLNKSMKERIYELEDERKQLMLKLGFDVSASKQNQLSDSNRSTFNTNPRSMLEIQSYMKQIGNLLDRKGQEKEQQFKGYEKLKHSIENLQKIL